MKKPIKTTLSNGLRVILLESHAAPVVSLNLWANVGSVNESEEEAGLCHLIEHMIFKGTSRREVGQIAKEVEAAGGDMNAYTSFDETVFYINMTSKRLDVGLDILADAATDPTFDEEELRREKEVVVEEISRAEDSPSQMVSQDLFKTAFEHHHYGRPVAGNRETVRGVSRDYLMAFFRRWYVGSNLIFIAVGDFEADEMLKKVEALFSKIPAGTPPHQSLPDEPLQTKPRVVARGMDVEGRYVDLAFPIPNLMHPDIPALDLLTHILGGGQSSRLEQVVKEKLRLMSSIGCFAYTPRHSCLMIIGGMLREKALKESVRAIWGEMEKLKDAPPTTVEFARARESLRSSRIYERRTVEGLARKYGYYEGIAGDLNFEETYYHRLSQVTPEDVREMARKYFSLERMTLAFCHPKSEAKVWTKEKLNALIPSPVVRRSSVQKIKKEGAVETFRLSSGVKVLVRENNDLPLVAIRTASLGGIRMETEKTNGISHLTSLLLTKGTSHRSARDIAEQMEGLQGHVDAYASRNIFGFHGSFLSEKLAEGFDLFFDIMLHPSFPEEEIKKEKARTYTAIRSQEDSLASVAMRKFLTSLYGKHPYSFSSLGTASSVRSLTRNHLIRYFQNVVTPSNCVISVVGDISASEVRDRLEDKLGDWKKRPFSLPRHSEPRPPTQPVTAMTHKKKLQTHIVYGFLGTTVDNKDRYVLDIMNAVLSGQGGRLFMELRDKRGLAYTVSSSSQEGMEPGHITVYMGTDPKNLEVALAGIQEELRKIRETLIGEEELERAKRFLIGNYELDLQKNESVAASLVVNEIYGVGYNELFLLPSRLEKVTAQDVLRVARKYLRPEASVLSVVNSRS